jgi:hypothetical protein
VTAAVIVFLFMLCELDSAPSNKYLDHTVVGTDADAHIASVRAAAPSVRWHVQCYHMETETHTSSDENGSHTETRTVRKNTHSASMDYRIFFWEDISIPLPSILKLSSNKITRLKFAKRFCFADAESAAHFEQQKAQFVRENDRDIKIEVTEQLVVEGYEDYILALQDADSAPCWLGPGGFCLAFCCCMTVLYRVLFNCVSWEIPEYTYVKRLYSHKTEPQFPIPTSVEIPAVTALPMHPMPLDLEAQAQTQARARALQAP